MSYYKEVEQLGQYALYMQSKLMHSYFKQFDTFLYKSEAELRLETREHRIIGISWGLPDDTYE